MHYHAEADPRARWTSEDHRLVIVEKFIPDNLTQKEVV
jgi:hypothetical protein